MASIFALPLPPPLQPTAGTYLNRVLKKRKRRLDEDQVEDVAPEHVKSSQTPEYSAVITPEERSQRHVAGQPFDQDPPKFPFPHAREPSHSENGPSKNSSSKHHLNTDDNAPRVSRGPTLHLQHLGAITAVLHRSLMAKDFSRASRALSLLLRDQFGGHDIDIRSEGRWGIGAEVLLRRGTGKEQQRPAHTAKSISIPPSADESPTAAVRKPSYTLAGFEDAKLYYEGLITQYPFQKLAATRVNALDFYVAMFSLWIFVVHEESKATDPSIEEAIWQDPESPVSVSSRIIPGKSQEMEGAQEIAARMDEVMSTFPFSDDVELIRLRAMVALWVADLIDYCADQPRDGNAMELEGEVNETAAAEGAGDSEEVLERGLASRIESTRNRETARELVGKLRQRSFPTE